MYKYEVIKDHADSEVYHFYVNGKKQQRMNSKDIWVETKWHAFSVHTDLIDDDIKQAIDNEGSAEVVMGFYCAVNNRAYV